jgi:MFS family permease
MKSPRVMYVYALFLIVCGFLAFAMAGFEMRALTALVAPAVMGGIMALMGWMASKIETNRIMGIIGVHVGMVLPLLFALMFARLAYARGTGDDPVIYLATIFGIMVLGSIITFVLILLTRPKPEARG